VWGLSTLSYALLTTGATVVLHVEFEPLDVLAEIEASAITLFAGTMSMYTALLHAVDARSFDLSSIRRLYRGGEPINNEVVRAIETRTGVRLCDSYATTEVSPVLVVNPVSDVDAPPGTVGRLVPGAKIRIVDDNGVEVKKGAVGEAWLGGQGVMLGYWNEPELTADRLTGDGWFRSGDLLVEGDRGYYFVVGRSIDVIIRNGAKIAPAEVESALNGLPGVRDSVAVGVPDEEFGESIVAYVLLDPDCVVSVDDVFDQLSDRIARFKLPEQIYFVADLPTQRNHKRDRATIRKSALDRQRQRADVAPPSAESNGRRLRLVQ
jgi:acyl-CoA synthetase (AMP-forming)/AMP-acid ligase II